MDISEKYLDKFLYELNLHDSEIVGIKLDNNCFEFEVSCKGMNPSDYFSNIEDVIINFKLTNIKTLEFDFLNGVITIMDFNYDKDKCSIDINDGDLFVAASNVEINCSMIEETNSSYKLLDDFLKSDK